MFIICYFILCIVMLSWLSRHGNCMETAQYKCAIYYNINPQFIFLRSKMRTLSISIVFRGFSRTIFHECRLRCQVFVGLTGCLAGVWSGFYMVLEIGCHTADYKPLVIRNSCFSKCPSWDAFSKSSEFANFVQSISNQHEWYMLVIRTLGSCAGVCFLRK